MSDPETHTPLIRAPSQQTAMDGPAQGRPSRAYKVAGLTLLACVLIAGQAMIAYFLLSQRGDIRSLREQNNDLKTELTKGSSGGTVRFSAGSVPMQVHMPMNTLTELMDDSVDEEATAGPDDAPPQQMTDCQMEAAGLKDVPVPNFRPICDHRGLYLPKQCYGRHCWCVNPENGREIRGRSCSRAAVLPAAGLRLLPLSEVDE